MNAIWLRKEGDFTVVLMEHQLLSTPDKKVWVELIREHNDGPFSHIIEPAGIEARRDEAIKAAASTRSRIHDYPVNTHRH